MSTAEFALTDAERLRILREYKRIAVVGMSPKEERPSNFVAMYMAHHGYEITPVNPGHSQIAGLKCYRSLREVPQPVEIVDVFRDSSAVPGVVEDAIEVGAKVLWLQVGVVHAEAAQRAKDAGLIVVMDRCIKVDHARLMR